LLCDTEHYDCYQWHKSHLRRREFIKLVEELIAAQPQFAQSLSKDLQAKKKEQQLKHLVPRSHKFQAQILLVTQSNKDHGLQRELLNNRSTDMSTAVVVDSQVVNCNRFSYQQVIHILRSLQAPEKVLDL
jgi:hypothetical protein